MRQKGFLLVLFFLFAQPLAAYPLNPNLEVTPSSVCTEDDTDFSGYRYREQIPYCSRNVSSSLKAYVYELYNIPKNCRKKFTIDHFIPLSIGGDNTLQNLWPEHKSIKADRPNLETELYQKLKQGKIDQQQAIAIIYREKTTYRRLAIHGACD